MRGWRSTTRRQLEPAADRWLDRTRFGWAHQGGAKEGPSNTVWAMRRAIAAGMDGLEVDIHRTRDDVLVCHHDATLRRMTGRAGRIRRLTYAELQAYDPAARWVAGHVHLQPDELQPDQRYELAGLAATDRSLRIPSLADVLAEFDGVPFTIELKGRTCESALATLLASCGRDDADTIVVSFWGHRVRRFRRGSPTTATAAPTWRLLLFWVLSRIRIAGPSGGHDALQAPRQLVDPAFVRAARRRRLAVHAWTVDDAAEMQELLAIGVQGIMSDAPAVLRDVLA